MPAGLLGAGGVQGSVSERGFKVSWRKPRRLVVGLVGPQAGLEKATTIIG